MNNRTVAVLWVLLVSSLALNALTLWFLFYARQVTVNTLGTARMLVDDIADDTIAYNYAVSQTVPIRVVVPIDEDVLVPISTTVPVNTVVDIELDTGVFGSIPLEVPIRAEFPVSVTLPVQVSKDVLIATSVPISLTVPIVVNIAESPLQVYLGRLSDDLGATIRALGAEPDLVNPVQVTPDGATPDGVTPDETVLPGQNP